MPRYLSLVVVSGTYPPDIGGSEHSIHTACKGLLERGHQITVVADDRRPSEHSYEGIRVIGCPPEQLEQELDKQHLDYEFDLVLTQLIYSPEALLWAKKKKIPSIYFTRNNEMKIDLSHSSKYSPTVLIANSRFIADKAQKRWKRNVEVLYPFIDLKETTPKSRDPKFITMINPFVFKGGLIFYNLAEHLPERLFLVAIGWTGLRRGDWTWHPRQWELISKAHADPSVHPPEEIDFSSLPNVSIVKGARDMRTVYSKTKVLLFPSQWEEAFGRSIVEALAAGIPVVATNVGGITETGLKNGGYLLEKDSSLQSWIEAIEQLDNPEEYDEKSCHARNDVAWYSLDCQLDKLETLLFATIDKTK